VVGGFLFAYKLFAPEVTNGEFPTTFMEPRPYSGIFILELERLFRPLAIKE
jgi:hypothetical protein